MTRYPLVWLTTPGAFISCRGGRRFRWRRPAPVTRHDRGYASGVGPLAGTGATVATSRTTCYSGCPELQRLLAEDAEVSAPELEVADGADLETAALRETGQVVDEQLRTRAVGREAVARVGQHERVREVGVRAVDQRDVTTVQRGRRVVGVNDPDRLGRDATRLEGNALLGRGGGGNADAEAGVHAERRVLELDRRVVNAVDATVREVGAGDAAVVQRNRGGNQAGREEVGRGALDRRSEVLGRVSVAGPEEDDRLADLRALTEHVQHVVRGVVRPERPAEDVDAVETPATRRGSRRSRHRANGANAVDEGQRRRTGEQ